MLPVPPLDKKIPGFSGREELHRRSSRKLGARAPALGPVWRHDDEHRETNDYYTQPLKILIIIVSRTSLLRSDRNRNNIQKRNIILYYTYKIRLKLLFFFFSILFCVYAVL